VRRRTQGGWWWAAPAPVGRRGRTRDRNRQLMQRAQLPDQLGVARSYLPRRCRAAAPLRPRSGRAQAGLGVGGAMPWGRFTLKRSRAPGAAPAGTSTVCAAPLGMRHLDVISFRHGGDN
jgi:hypothetical protein